MAHTNKNTAAPRPSERKLKEQMCEIGRRIWQKGFCAGNEGNHSCRISESRILCTPSLMSKGFMKPEDLCIVDLDGSQLAGKRKRTSEILLHLAIYKARPDVNGVVHSHPPHATAFAVAGVEMPSCIHSEAELFLGPVRTAKYVTPGDNRLPESIAPFVKDSNTILLGNHGVVCFGPDLEDAYHKLEIVDAYARILILAKQIGSIRQLQPDEMKELLALKSKFGQSDPRVTQGNVVAGGAMYGNSDFVSCVSRDVAMRGRVADACGDVAQSFLPGAPGWPGVSTLSETELEELVKLITDQIMSTASQLISKRET